MEAGAQCLPVCEHWKGAVGQDCGPTHRLGFVAGQVQALYNRLHNWSLHGTTQSQEAQEGPNMQGLATTPGTSSRYGKQAASRT